MPTLMIPPLIVLLPILLGGALIGLRRGWKDEAWTAGALIVTLVVLAINIVARLLLRRRR